MVWTVWQRVQAWEMQPGSEGWRPCSGDSMAVGAGMAAVTESLELTSSMAINRQRVN